MNKDLLLIKTAAFLRSVIVGLTGVVVGVYLFRNGFSSLDIGLVIGAGLAGAAVATLVVSLRADLSRTKTYAFLARSAWLHRRYRFGDYSLLCPFSWCWPSSEC
jgi:hypothetical protein